MQGVVCCQMTYRRREWIGSTKLPDVLTCRQGALSRHPLAAPDIGHYAHMHSTPEPRRWIRFLTGYRGRWVVRRQPQFGFRRGSFSGNDIFADRTARLLGLLLIERARRDEKPRRGAISGRFRACRLRNLIRGSEQRRGCEYPEAYDRGCTMCSYSNAEAGSAQVQPTTE